MDDGFSMAIFEWSDAHVRNGVGRIFSVNATHFGKRLSAKAMRPCRFSLVDSAVSLHEAAGPMGLDRVFRPHAIPAHSPGWHCAGYRGGGRV